jgi:hypothetical protein
MDLNGRWLASVSTEELRRLAADPDFDDSSWAGAEVPGHWRSNPEFGATDGPVLYRRRFEATRPGPGRRRFLTFDGIFYQGDVWLDGEYLGVTEGYFAPHTFEVTEVLRARTEHVLTVEVACARPTELTSKRNLTGVFQHWDCIDPDWNPGGIWAPVHLDETGPVRITAVKVLCREANAERAVLDIEAALDTVEPCGVLLGTRVTRVPAPAGVAAPGLTDDPDRPEGPVRPNQPDLPEHPDLLDEPVLEEGHDHVLAAGVNIVRWQARIERPDLWWPKALGDQPLHEVLLEARLIPSDNARRPAWGPDDPVGEAPAGKETAGDNTDKTTARDSSADPLTRTGASGNGFAGDGLDVARGSTAPGLDRSSSPEAEEPTAPSDSRRVVTGIRQIRFHNFVATVNGERMFLKGVNCGPTHAALAEVDAEAIARDVELAAAAGLDLIRVHAHISRPELYEAADRTGMLVWQDLPLQWGYGQVRRQAVTQAREAVTLLGHHPSIALWCGHNEPLALDTAHGKPLAASRVARFVAGQVLPTWNKTALDRSIRRALERADPSREVIAHSGVLPHPAWGTDSHFYFGWYHGDERDLPSTLARLPVLARFVSEFGAQAVPDSAGFMHPERWPDLDWEHLEAHHCYQREIFDQRVPPDGFVTFGAWRRATQDYQASLLRHHIETLRRLKYRPTGGFCVFLLADAQPAVTWSLLDHERAPKAGYRAVAAACAPVIVTADRPDASYRPGQRFEVDLHAVSDLRHPLEGVEAQAVLTWPGGRRTWVFQGDLPADSCTRIGHVLQALPPDCPEGDVSLDLTMSWADGKATNKYASRVTAGG